MDETVEISTRRTPLPVLVAGVALVFILTVTWLAHGASAFAKSSLMASTTIPTSDTPMPGPSLTHPVPPHATSTATVTPPPSDAPATATPSTSSSTPTGQVSAAQMLTPEETEAANRVDYESLNNIIAPKPHRYYLVSEVIAQAMQNNLQVELKRLQSGIEADRLTQAKGAFEPSINMTGNYEKINTPQNAQEFVATGGTTFELNQLNGIPRIFHEENYHWKTSLEGKLPLGTQYEIFNQWDDLRNDLNENSALSLFSPEYGVTNGITITQPLLKDFGTDVNMAEIRVARKDKFASELDVKASLLAAVAEVMKNYVDLAFATQNVKLCQEDVSLALKLTENRRDQMERGLATRHDMSRSQSALAESVEKLVQAENERLDRQNSLIRLISQDIKPGDNTQIVPLVHFFEGKVHFDRDRLIATAFHCRPDYLAAQERVDRDQIKVVYAQNQILPRVDLKSTVGANGLAPSPGQSFDRARYPEGPQYSVGFLVNIPLGDEAATGKRDEVIKERRISITNLKMAEVDVILEINKSLDSLEVNYKRLESMRMFRDSAEENYESERTRLEKGLTTEVEVFRNHRDLTEAKTREMAAIADYDKALIALYAANGTLLEHEKILLDK